MKLSFEFPASTSILSDIGKLVCEAAQKEGFSEEEIGDIQLAVDEACANTIIHGLRKDPTRYFTLELNSGAGEIEIIIKEIGVSFELRNIKEVDVNAPLEEREIGGLGFFFVQNMMDIVDYQVRDDGMKILRMVKKMKKT